MIKEEIVITNETGLHARPVSVFVETAGEYEAEIKVIKGLRKLMLKVLWD